MSTLRSLKSCSAPLVLCNFSLSLQARWLPTIEIKGRGSLANYAGHVAVARHKVIILRRKMVKNNAREEAFFHARLHIGQRPRQLRKEVLFVFCGIKLRLQRLVQIKGWVQGVT